MYISLDEHAILPRLALAKVPEQQAENLTVLHSDTLTHHRQNAVTDVQKLDLQDHHDCLGCSLGIGAVL